MLEEIKGIEKKIGTNTNIEKIIFFGMPAVRRTFILNGTKILFIDFMIENISHNIMYSAPPTEFENYLSVAQVSINTYEPTLIGVSPEDVNKHTLAQSLRLSQIFFKKGNYDLSLEFINEGLEVEPNNPKLLELKNIILGLKNEKPKEDNVNKTKDKKDKSDDTDPAVFVIVALAGALIITFRKSLANGTVAPGFASFTTPIIGAGLILFGLFSGLFDGGYIVLGIFTSLVVIIILAAPVLIPVISEKRGKK